VFHIYLPQLVDGLNKVRHAPKQELESTQLDDFVQLFVDFLQSSGQIKDDEDAQKTIRDISEVMLINPLHNTAKDWLNRGLKHKRVISLEDLLEYCDTFKQILRSDA